MTQVKFLIEKKEGKLPCNVFAFFPQMEYSNTSNGMFTCYAHLGQHGGCHIDYAKECKLANYNEYYSLLMELIGQGYNDLQVLNYETQTRQCHRPPTKSEINFGEWATHYRDFKLSEIGHNKKGKLKSWFIDNTDGLRYYTN